MYKRQVVDEASLVAESSEDAAEVVMLGRVVVESLAVLLSEHPAVRATKAIRAEVNLSAAGFLFAIVTSVPLVASVTLASSSNSYVSTRVQLFHSMGRLDVGGRLYE